MRHEEEITKPFPCNICGVSYAYPFEQVKCQDSHSNPSKAPSRVEKVLMRLLAMVDPQHADQAGAYADEIFEAIRK